MIRRIAFILSDLRVLLYHLVEMYYGLQRISVDAGWMTDMLLTAILDK